MKKRSKRFSEATKSFEVDKTYPLQEALELMKKIGSTKFKESVEIHIKTGINASKSDQLIRGTVILPHGTGKTKRIAVFAIEDSKAAKDAKDAGADIIAGKEFIQEIKKTGKIDFDVAIATPDIMRDLSALARVLGPKGLMPSPKNGTVTAEVKKAVEDVKGGKVAFKNDDTANVHQVVGKAEWDVKKLQENIESFMEAIKKVKPTSSKGTYIQGITICSTMGPGIKVSL